MFFSDRSGINGKYLQWTLVIITHASQYSSLVETLPILRVRYLFLLVERITLQNKHCHITHTLHPHAKPTDNVFISTDGVGFIAAF